MSSFQFFYVSPQCNIVSLIDNSSDPEKESLAQEIELGKSLEGDRHPNIVNFLACVSTSGKIGSVGYCTNNNKNDHAVKGLCLNYHKRFSGQMYQAYFTIV